MKLRLTKDYDVCLENFKGYLNFNEAILRKLTTSIKLLNIEMQTVSSRMKEISDIFGQMYCASEKASDVNFSIFRILLLNKPTKCLVY